MSKVPDSMGSERGPVQYLHTYRGQHTDCSSRARMPLRHNGAVSRPSCVHDECDCYGRNRLDKIGWRSFDTQYREPGERQCNGGTG